METPDKMVSAYINIRNAIHEKEQEIKELKEKQAAISDAMLELFSDQNIDSMKTKYGTASRRVYSTYWTSDWEAMYNFIRDNDAFHLLEKRIHNGNMREFINENPDDRLPIGLQSNTKYILSVRKPTKTGDI